MYSNQILEVIFYTVLLLLFTTTMRLFLNHDTIDIDKKISKKSIANIWL